MAAEGAQKAGEGSGSAVEGAECLNLEGAQSGSGVDSVDVVEETEGGGGIGPRVLVGVGEVLVDKNGHLVAADGALVASASSRLCRGVC